MSHFQTTNASAPIERSSSEHRITSRFGCAVHIHFHMPPRGDLHLHPTTFSTFGGILRLRDVYRVAISEFCTELPSMSPEHLGGRFTNLKVPMNRYFYSYRSYPLVRSSSLTHSFDHPHHLPSSPKPHRSPIHAELEGLGSTPSTAPPILVLGIPKSLSSLWLQSE